MSQSVVMAVVGASLFSSQTTQTAIKVNQVCNPACDNYILYGDVPMGSTARCKALDSSVLAPSVSEVAQKKTFPNWDRQEKLRPPQKGLKSTQECQRRYNF